MEQKRPDEKRRRPPPKLEPRPQPAKPRNIAANKADWEQDEE